MRSLNKKKIAQKCAVFLVLCLVLFASGCSSISGPGRVLSPDQPGQPSSRSTSSLSDKSEDEDEDESEERTYPQSDKQEHRFDMGEDILEVSIQINEMHVFPADTSKNPGNQNLLLVFCSISNYTDESISPYQEWLAHTHISFDGKEITPDAADTSDITSLTNGAGEVLMPRTKGDYAIPYWLTGSPEISYDSTLSVYFEDDVDSMRTTFSAGEFPPVADLIVE
ncbi:MAG TPA: hypothetical protein IAA58_06295 [Candidatus Gallacutalibacter stercoravium]|nr:hypothetical protein [Candidatus Gallacutalibacter stercoravium]